MVAGGVCVIDDAVAPVLQTYDVPPNAVKVRVPPGQIESDGGVTPTTGGGFPTTFLVAEAVQPFTSVTVTLYVDVDDGVKLIVVVVSPVLQK